MFQINLFTASEFYNPNSNWHQRGKGGKNSEDTIPAGRTCSNLTPDLGHGHRGHQDHTVCFPVTSTQVLPSAVLPHILQPSTPTRTSPSLSNILLSIQLQKVPISRVGIVAQCVKPQPVTPASHIWVLLHVLATSFPVQLPANMPGKGAEAHPSAWTPATHVGDLDALLDCWSSPDPALAIVVIWEPNQQMDNLCLPVTLSNKFSKVKVPTSSLGKPSQNASISSRIAHVTFHTYQ